MMNSLWTEYGQWLLNRVGFHKRNYSILMKHLHNSPFEPMMERDENRSADGTMLRGDFFSDIGVSGDFLDRECSVLEMLVGLSIRIDEEYIGNPAEPHPEIIFWKMICNLGLNRYIDKIFEYDAVFEILKTWILREFSFDGRGSIFPLKYPETDQRNCEIWSQMQAYLDENY